MKMKSLLILFFVLFNCLFISAYGDEEFLDYDDFFETIRQSEYYDSILEAFCANREMGIFVCSFYFDNDIYLCRDLIDYCLSRTECPFSEPTTLKEKCDLIESLIKKMMGKNIVSERQILILIDKFQKRFNCPVRK